MQHGVHSGGRRASFVTPVRLVNRRASSHDNVPQFFEEAAYELRGQRGSQRKFQAEETCTKASFTPTYQTRTARNFIENDMHTSVHDS